MSRAALSKVEVSGSNEWSAEQPEGQKVLWLRDRESGFAAAAHARVGNALVRCEERYPSEGLHSVLYVVVTREPGRWREELMAIFIEHFGSDTGDPLAPLYLEVLDREMDETLQRLTGLGLISQSTRATRTLWPLQQSTTVLRPLTQAERERSAAFRQQAGRKLRMARLLNEGSLGEEARSAVLDAMLPLGRALAIEARLAEPNQLSEVLLAPLAQHWGESLTSLRLFVTETSAPVRPVLEQLAVLQTEAAQRWNKTQVAI